MYIINIYVKQFFIKMWSLINISTVLNTNTKKNFL